MGIELFGIKINNYTFDEGVKKACELIESAISAQVVTINPEMFTQAENDDEFKKILNDAEMVIPDGVGVKLGLKLKGINVSRIPGIDFARKMLEISAQNGYPVAIVGAKEEVISKAIVNLKNEIPNLKIVYTHNGYFSDENEIYEGLKNTSPRVILAALGSPKQEYFIYKAKTILNPALMIGIGGSLDVWSGDLKRAPEVFRKLGLEWLYRTVCQPERIKRIFPALPIFLIKVLFYRGKK